MATMAEAPRVGLFITCLIDMFRPSVGFAAIKLLEDAGCQVHVPVAQTCCGQTAWNANDKADTREIAQEVIQNFEGFDYIITPSKPCSIMLRSNYLTLFDGDAKWAQRVSDFTQKTYELTVFLEEVLGIDTLDETIAKRADILTSNDLGELMEISKNLKRQGIQKEIRHVCEVLAGMTDSPSIGAR